MLALASDEGCNRMTWAVAMLDTTGTCKKDGLVQWYVCPLPILRAVYQCLLEHWGAKQDCNMNNMRSEHCLSFIQERMANLNSYTGLLFHYTGQSWDRPPKNTSYIRGNLTKKRLAPILEDNHDTTDKTDSKRNKQRVSLQLKYI